MGTRSCKWCGRSFDAGFFLWADDFCSTKCKVEASGPIDSVAQQAMARAAEGTERALAALARAQENASELRSRELSLLAPSDSKSAQSSPLGNEEFFHRLETQLSHQQFVSRLQQHHDEHIIELKRSHEDEVAWLKGKLQEARAIHEKHTRSLEANTEKRRKIYEEQIHALRAEIEILLSQTVDAGSPVLSRADGALPTSIAEVFDRPVALRNAATKTAHVPHGHVVVVANFFSSSADPSNEADAQARALIDITAAARFRASELSNLIERLQALHESLDEGLRIADAL